MEEQRVKNGQDICEQEPEEGLAPPEIKYPHKAMLVKTT